MHRAPLPILAPVFFTFSGCASVVLGSKLPVSSEKRKPRLCPPLLFVGCSVRPGRESAPQIHGARQAGRRSGKDGLLAPAVSLSFESYLRSFGDPFLSFSAPTALVYFGPSTLQSRPGFLLYRTVDASLQGAFGPCQLLQRISRFMMDLAGKNPGPEDGGTHPKSPCQTEESLSLEDKGILAKLARIRLYRLRFLQAYY